MEKAMAKVTGMDWLRDLATVALRFAKRLSDVIGVETGRQQRAEGRARQ
jgi:hypothetical protein